MADEKKVVEEVVETKGLSPEFVSNKELRKQCGALNKSGVIKEKIMSVGKSREELYHLFLDGIDSVAVGSEDEKKIPESCILFYNSIVEGKDPSPEEQAEIKAKKAKKDPKPRGPNFEMKAYELVKGMEGKTPEEILTAAIALYTPLYAAKTPPKTEAEFIKSRSIIYVNIAVKKIKKEGSVVEVAEGATV